jgi:dienelactone hydrolase
MRHEIGGSRRALAALLFLACAFPVPPAWAQDSPAPEPLARDIREEVQHVNVTVSDAFGRTATLPIPVTIFRPPGDGPFPLVVMNHGRAIDAERMKQGRARYDHFARYLVNKGFTVFIPTRVGYAETYGKLDPEDLLGCASPRLEPAATAAADQVVATVEYARTLPYVDASRWIVMGQSLGGFTSVAVAWRNPPGLVGAVNFSGGHGGNPVTHAGNPCGDAVLRHLWATKAAQAKVPMLWFYWENDQFFGPSAPRRWHAAWTENGGRAEFHQLPGFGKDGHQGIVGDMEHWVPFMEQYLASLGFAKPGVPLRPPPSGFAQVTDRDKVPYGGGNSALYERFLAMPLPRAIAIGAEGAQGIATGDWVIGRALGLCQQKRGAPCKLYAVDADVVWTK